MSYLPRGAFLESWQWLTVDVSGGVASVLLHAATTPHFSHICLTSPVQANSSLYVNQIPGPSRHFSFGLYEIKRAHKAAKAYSVNIFKRNRSRLDPSSMPSSHLFHGVVTEFNIDPLDRVLVADAADWRKSNLAERCNMSKYIELKIEMQYCHNAHIAGPFQVCTSWKDGERSRHPSGNHLRLSGLGVLLSDYAEPRTY